jgi:hypothetical protein
MLGSLIAGTRGASGASAAGACFTSGSGGATGTATGTISWYGSMWSMNEELCDLNATFSWNNRRPEKSSACPKWLICGISSRFEIKVLFVCAVAGAVLEPRCTARGASGAGTT